MHLFRTKLLLIRVLTLALLVAIAASPFGRAPLGAGGTGGFGFAASSTPS